MSKSNKKLDKEIDAGQFFGCLFSIVTLIGSVWALIWFFTDVYKINEVLLSKNLRYAYSIIQKEAISLYEKQKYVFDEKIDNNDKFCEYLADKYGERSSGTCSNYNPLIPTQNFQLKNKKIAIYGLEKAPFNLYGTIVKDILVDINGEDKGENQVGSDRMILRIYSSGRVGGFVTPVNCSTQDEQEYGLKKSTYCIGSPDVDYLITNKPLGFDIQQIGLESGKTRIIGSNLPFLRADCSAFDGFITGADEYCEDKQLYSLSGCEDEYECNIALTRQ